MFLKTKKKTKNLMKVPREATKRPVKKYKPCTFLKCTKLAQGATRRKGAIGLCSKHGGGPRCQGFDEDGTECKKGALGFTGFCFAHGGGPRCQGFDEDGTECKKGARGSTGFCAAHGGGPRCQGFEEDGAKCKKSAQGSTGFCSSHGGGPLCQGFDEDGTECKNGARGSTRFCKSHGGGPRCQGFDEDGTECKKGARGSILFCAAHKGGPRCPNCINWIDTRIGQKKFDGYCATCYYRLNPNTPRPVFRNYKTKEFAVLRHLEQEFPSHHIVNDRRIDGGCSKKKPDFFFELLTHVIMVEVDENGHMSYDKTCENKRMMELSEDIAHRPLVFIRFNPDRTSTKPGCWGVDEKGVAVVVKKQAGEWRKRLAELTATITFWLTTIPDKTVFLIKLYY